MLYTLLQGGEGEVKSLKNQKRGDKCSSWSVQWSMGIQHVVWKEERFILFSISSYI